MQKFIDISNNILSQYFTLIDNHNGSYFAQLNESLRNIIKTDYIKVLSFYNNHLNMDQDALQAYKVIKYLYDGIASLSPEIQECLSSRRDAFPLIHNLKIKWEDLKDLDISQVEMLTQKSILEVIKNCHFTFSHLKTLSAEAIEMTTWSYVHENNYLSTVDSFRKMYGLYLTNNTYKLDSNYLSTAVDVIHQTNAVYDYNNISQYETLYPNLKSLIIHKLLAANIVGIKELQSLPINRLYEFLNVCHTHEYKSEIIEDYKNLYFSKENKEENIHKTENVTSTDYMSALSEDTFKFIDRENERKDLNKDSDRTL